MVNQPSLPLNQSAPNYTKQAWLVIGAWSVFLALCLLGRGGKLLIPLFPLGSVAVGLFLYFRTPVLYVGYTWWIIFLGSLVRRIIDQQSGYVTPGRWGTTALLVASISLITLVQYLPKTYRSGGMPFLIALIGAIYGCLLGVVYGRLSLPQIVNYLEWTIPIVFGFHMFVRWQDYPHYRRVMQRAFVWGVLVMGSYGIFQYCVAPEWDRFYLNNIEASSFGNPFPFEIRVFSTQGSPQSFGNMMMAGLLLLLSSTEHVRFAASGVGYLSFLLSAARSGWLGWVGGLLALVPSLSLKFQMRLVLTISLMVLLVVPLTNMEPFAEPIRQRLESFSEGQDDYSLQERTQGYEELLGLALTEFIGRGIGGQVDSASIGASDSGVLPLLFSLGWFGALPYLLGISMIVYQMLQTKGGNQDPFVGATKAIVAGSLTQVWLNNIFASDMAIVLWSFLGMGMAASKYYTHQAIIQWSR